MTSLRRIARVSALTAALGMMAAVPSGPAKAVLIDCPEQGFAAEPDAKVENRRGRRTATSACEHLSPSDPHYAITINGINLAGFFGFDDWEGNGQTRLHAPSKIGQSGTWAIKNVDFDLYDYLIVFKAPGKIVNATAFLFNESFSRGVWSTPFTDMVFDVHEPRDVSRLTIARRLHEPAPVPEPASLLLLGGGLLGLALIRRRGSA